jgi:hypothetical protein
MSSIIRQISWQLKCSTSYGRIRRHPTPSCRVGDALEAPHAEPKECRRAPHCREPPRSPTHCQGPSGKDPLALHFILSKRAQVAVPRSSRSEAPARPPLPVEPPHPTGSPVSHTSHSRRPGLDPRYRFVCN